MRVFVKEPGMDPEEMQIENTLEALQNLVGGFIEVVPMAADAAIVVNEEGIIRDLPYNTCYCGQFLFGTMVFVGVDGEEFSDVPISFEEFREISRSLFK